jgi:hypothetical protein
VAELHHEPVDLSAPRWDRPYPKVPAGWTLGPPDFIGIGAQKAGTSWWYGLLRAHPDVADTELKETHHLITLGWRPMSERDVLSYHRYFPRPVGALVGEWTPRYMPTPGVVDTMRACAPEAKLLAILRNPVERYRSGVAEWIRGKDRRGRPGRLASGREDALVRSFYGFPLERFIQAFGRQRVLIQQFEKCQADPGGEYRRMLRFLELPDWEPSQDELSTPVNVAATTASTDDLAEPDDLAGWFEDDVRLLKDLAPDFELSLWPQFSHLA